MGMKSRVSDYALSVWLTSMNIEDVIQTIIIMASNIDNYYP